ncbi:Mitochondrial thiamine pyrophosphate carrier 1 [Fulvia fulva]|uniref:Mitochondrial thiamine pyrophosphate carrier 1 n=1 Tax=Passalora fulva TaxID=5499 RepID=A0A9Q8P2A5_PASFU|nr:Mitochondrial thiamine pyrophosphate carrier 1 [Fulvia fulva]KAK4635626.1 Mitochondrial thiamine pyrophosphate carrier 1 [Fulvia fulva]KAK4638265.1 Mitochondrial thiamine pyrophosphate carrier 1 [Fulvia fulva]UJO10785.1 Mitochondrial thiamine pyrophosphate carrier 1 [Fulvia fulva]WPV09442.1 Mitochondrial thiamine pyrophosphate carrier 1 [Fulvia fulva]WPV23070.1 Mitochondrial thiamine pyrophosphate carrier 1 [Fulvia fulva]
MSHPPTPIQTRDEGTRLQVVLAGAISGLISRFCIAPLDVVKIRLQLHYHSLADPLSTPLRSRPTPTGIFLTVKDIYTHEGLPGFWKGNIPAEGLYLGYAAVQFLTYRSVSQALNKLEEDLKVNINGTAKSFIAGAIAGTAATTTTYPLDLLRTRFAAQGTERVYDGLLASIRDISRHEGAAGWFKGLNAGIGQIVPYMGLFFALYEGLKPSLATIQLPFGSGDAVAGVTASVLSKTAVFPLDTVRKRLQVQGPTRGRYIGGARVPVYERGVVGTLGMILRKEGAVGLYRGLTVSLVKAAPSSAVTMWAYERALHLIMKMGDSDGVD